MTDKKTKTDRDLIIARMDREEDIFHHRLTLFGAINVLAATAVQLNAVRPDARFGIGATTALINLMWLICSSHTIKNRRSLGEELHRREDIPDAVRKTFNDKTPFRPEVIIGVYLPTVLAFVWVVVEYANFAHWIDS